MKLGSVFYVLIASYFGILSVFAGNKFEEFTSPSSASTLLNKCLAPLKTFFTVNDEEKMMQPRCSIEEFENFTLNDLLQLGPKQISSLPASYFKTLKSELATEIPVQFIGQLEKQQILAFSQETIEALPLNSRKLLQKIKSKPGPLARAIIMFLSAITAIVIFKFS